MEHTYNKPRFTRLTSLLLALVMVLSMFPVTAFAAGNSLKITDAEGNEKDTFVVGEPIYVTATATSSSDWIGFYDTNYASTSAFWYYVSDANGEAYNVYDGEPNTGWEGWMMEPNSNGRYEVRLVEAGITKKINIVAPEDSSAYSLEVAKTELNAGESIKVTATAYSNYAWVGLYKGHTDANATYGTSEQYYNCTGHNGVEMEFTTGAETEYTVVLFANAAKNSVLEVVNVRVKTVGFF